MSYTALFDPRRRYIMDSAAPYLYNPELCPCPRGKEVNCPRYKNCEACVAFHRTEGNPPQTACEKKAGVPGRDGIVKE